MTLVSPVSGLKSAINGKFPKGNSDSINLVVRGNRKKMNFTTDLPKRNPLVSYIVASAVRCEKFFPGQTKEGPVFRMHAVILKSKPHWVKNAVTSDEGKKSNSASNP